MVYTVKQLAKMANISVRTLHYYDEIKLLEPSWVGENGYRYYDDDSVIRLQQVLFFKELDLSLDDIKNIVDDPGFDVLAALDTHRERIQARINRLNTLINTIDSTVLHLMGEIEMSKKQLFSGLSEEQEQQYYQQARDQYDPKEVDASYKRWNNYTAEKKEQIKAEGNAIYQDAANLIGITPDSADIQQVIARWHQHMCYFYEPSIERLRGLGQMYVEHPDFARNFREVHPDLPEFLCEAIAVYCDNLEK